ncbi:sulfotransferase 6B1-like [Lissotriton helveticus]
MSNLKRLVEINEKLSAAAKDKTPEELVFTHKGVLYPSMLCSPETFQALDAFQLRADDLLLVSYPKCGTNWTVQILHDMIYTVHGKEPPPLMAMLEFGSPDKFESLNQIPPRRVLTTHLHRDKIPRSMEVNKVKTLVVFRNPKDTAVSLFHFYNSLALLPNYSSWDEFFEYFMTGKVIYSSWFEYAIAWNEHIDDENVMVLMFEEMKVDLEAAVKKISVFFGVHLTEEQILLITERGGFKAMKERSSETHGSVGSTIFRKGDVGDWKNYFSEAQSREMDAKFEECLGGTKLGEMMNYKTHCKS